MRIFADWFNRVWKTFPNGINDGVGDATAHAAEMRRAVTLFESLLDGREFLFGEFGLADVIGLPVPQVRARSASLPATTTRSTPFSSSTCPSKSARRCMPGSPVSTRYLRS